MGRAQLSAARYKKHWSLEEAAERLGVDKATLQRWETELVTYFEETSIQKMY